MGVTDEDLIFATKFVLFKLNLYALRANVSLMGFSLQFSMF